MPVHSRARRLHNAASKGHEAVVTALLEKGANKEAQDKVCRSLRVRGCAVRVRALGVLRRGWHS